MIIHYLDAIEMVCTLCSRENISNFDDLCKECPAKKAADIFRAKGEHKLKRYNMSLTLHVDDPGPYIATIHGYGEDEAKQEAALMLMESMLEISDVEEVVEKEE